MKNSLIATTFYLIVFILYSPDYSEGNDEQLTKAYYTVTINDENTTGFLYFNRKGSYFQWFMSDDNHIYETIDKNDLHFEIEIKNKKGLFVCKDLENDKMVSKEASIFNQSLVSDVLPSIEWNIKSDTKRIGGYVGIKAEGSFRGRKYIVWFTPEIPINNGPWKLGGLPGLILKVEDIDRKIYIKAKKISKYSEYNLITNSCNFENEKLLQWSEYKELYNGEIRDLKKLLKNNSRIVKIETQFSLELLK